MERLFLNRLGSVLKTLKLIQPDVTVASAKPSSLSPFEYIIRGNNEFGLETELMINFYGLVTMLETGGFPDLAKLWLEIINEKMLNLSSDEV